MCAAKRSRLRVVYQPTTMTPRIGEDGAAIGASLYPPSANPCPNCAAACCTHRVETSLPDVLRLCTALSLPFHTAFELAPDGQRPFELAEGPRVAVLRRSADGYCRFLGRYDDELRCGVYGLRPATCRLYPFIFQVGDLRIGPRSVRCPVPFGIGAELERELGKAARQAIEDWALHEAIAAEWKRAAGEDRGLRAFLRFAVARLGADPERSPLLEEQGSAARHVRMLVDHRVLRPPRG